MTLSATQATEGTGATAVDIDSAGGIDVDAAGQIALTLTLSASLTAVNIEATTATSGVTISSTTGYGVEIQGQRHYGISATDPGGTAPSDGDRYYNSAIIQEMYYDGTRTKWFSVATLMDGVGRNGTTVASGFYRRWNGMILAAAQGPLIQKGTIVGIGYSTSAAVAHTYEVLVGGAVVASLVSGGAASAISNTLNADYIAGILSSRNVAASATTTTNFQSVIYYKLHV